MATQQNKAEQPKGLLPKLFNIQKAFMTFSATEDAEKKDSRGVSEYKYTPGWKIVESVREKMDELGLMLIPEVEVERVQLIDYPVYKPFGGQPMSFQKKEVFVVVKAQYTWIDVESGETYGPVRHDSAGANGTDKSFSCAVSNSERYFLLKFFHITTRSAEDEPDAHDSTVIPGIPKSQQAAVATDFQAVNAAPVPSFGPAPAPVQQAPQQGLFPPQGPVPAPVMGQQQPAPAQRAPRGRAQAQPEVRNPFAAAPSYAAPAQSAGVKSSFDPNDERIRSAAARLMTFDKGTPTHQQTLNEVIGGLSAAGFACFEGNFLGNLVEYGQAMREQRQPVFA